VRYLLDTCVVSELRAKRPDPEVVSWIDNVDPDNLYLSVVTLGEVQKGIEKVKDPVMKTALTSWLRDELLVRFQDHILGLDTNILLQWGALAGRLETLGTPMPAIDSLLAATALDRSLVLVTRNESDFRASGVQILNPWKLS
jgi:tRNA(fMet)-specific endonuclease VapC